MTATSSRRTLLTFVANPDWLGLSPLSYVVKWVPRKLDLTTKIYYCNRNKYPTVYYDQSMWVERAKNWVEQSRAWSRHVWQKMMEQEQSARSQSGNRAGSRLNWPLVARLNLTFHSTDFIRYIVRWPVCTELSAVYFFSPHSYFLMQSLITCSNLAIKCALYISEIQQTNQVAGWASLTTKVSKTWNKELFKPVFECHDTVRLSQLISWTREESSKHMV